MSALVVMLAMYTTITERTREIGILKARALRAATSSRRLKKRRLISFMGS